MFQLQFCLILADQIKQKNQVSAHLVLDATISFDVGLENPLSTSEKARPHNNVNNLFKHSVRHMGAW